VSLSHFVFSYRLRVGIPYRQMLGAMVVFMSVQWTVASAAFQAALPASRNYFHRTRKGSGAMVGTRIMTMQETVIGGLLVVGSITVFATNFDRFFETDLFSAILLIQSLPFLSAMALVGLERVSDSKLKKNDRCSGDNLSRLFGACGWAPRTKKVVSVTCLGSPPVTGARSARASGGGPLSSQDVTGEQYWVKL
jgi:hypothetical protein